MKLNFYTALTAGLAFASTSSGHLIMKTPVPFGVSTLNNSPLLNAKPGTSGSDYPCKQRPGVYDITKQNVIPVDTPTEMSFIGSVSHGGGTCQIAITKDLEPAANSTFKIIQVFEGGCPINSDGNTGTHPFSFTIPKEFPSGKFVLTWLWYNRIGNREAYMNCAPITITGGSSNGDDYFDSLPNMYLINLPTEECQSTEGWQSNSVEIPNPGQYIMREAAGQSIAKASGPSCAASAAAQTEGVKGYKASPVITTNGAAYSAPGGAAASPAPSGSGAASYAAPSGAAGGLSAAAGSGAAGSNAAPSSPASATPGSSAGSGSSGMVTITTASGSASAFPSMAPSAGAGVYGPSSAGVGSAAPSGSASSGGSCTSSGGISCSSNGKQFGMCANGEMVWQDVAPGTSCKNGQILKRADHAWKHVRGVRRHL